jgi:glutamyl-tRNA reductase
MEFGIEVDAGKTKYMVMYHQNTGQSHNIKIANRSCERATKLKYMGMTVNNSNCIHK